MESVASFKVVYQPGKKTKPVQPAVQSEERSEVQSEVQVNSEQNASQNVAVDDNSEPIDELARAKQAIKAWQNKANSLQKRNELLETEILMLKNESMQHSMTNGDASSKPEGEGEAETEDAEVDEVDAEEEDEDEDEEDEEDDEPPRTRSELERDLENTKDQLEEMTELYEELLRQRNNEMRLKRYSTVDGQAVKAKVADLQVQMEQLKAKHQDELSKKNDEMQIIEERAERDRSKVTMLRKELESVKTENVNLLLEKKKLERSLQKVYSAKQKRREQAEDTIKEIEVSTLRLKNSRLQMELQKVQTSPPHSMYSSQENLLDSLNRSQEFGKSGSTSDGVDFPPSTESRERELETEIDSLKEEIQTLNTKLASESEQNKTMVEHWEQQLADSEEKVKTLQTKLEKTNIEVEMLSNELEIAETAVDELTTRLEDTEAELAEKLKEREDELSEINEALEDAQGQLKNIPSDTVVLQEKVLKLQQELEETRNTLAETKKQLDKEIIAVSWKNQEIAQLHNKLQE